MTRTFVAPGTSSAPRAHLPALNAPAAERRLSSRARLRLNIAARLLRIRKGGAADEDTFLAEVLVAIRAMGHSKQLELRSLVDWVEDYEASSESVTRPRSRKRV
jgi:hypothetical protein